VVDGRALVNLIVQDGDEVAALGDLVSSTDASQTLWISRAWEPTQRSRLVNSDIAVEMRAGLSLPPEGSIVLVTGIWRLGAITDARWNVPAEFKQPMLPSSPDKMKPAEVFDLLQGFSEGIEADGGDAHLISGGGTKDALWIHLRTMTPAIEHRVSAFPGRVDVFTAVTPAP
jgi:hypothetical protein